MHFCRITSGGSARFVSVGDDLWVCDLKNGDSYGAGATLIDVDNDVDLEWVYDGVPDGACVSSHQNLPEGLRVELVVCLYREGGPNYCTWSNPTGVT